MSMFSSDHNEKAWLRAAIGGPSGSGKTRTALEIATGLVAVYGGKIAVLDTEHGSAAKMRPLGLKFDDIRIKDYNVDKYIAVIKGAKAEGYTVLVIDSLSHAWMGKGGILDMVDKGGGKFNKWQDATPKQRELFECINATDIHIIATMRVETAYVMEEQTNREGKKVTVPVVVGVKPIQRKDSQYEFDMYITMDRHHTLRFEKSRCQELDGKEIARPTSELGKTIARWLDTVSGVETLVEPAAQRQTSVSLPGPVVTAVSSTIPLATKEQGEEMLGLTRSLFGEGPEAKEAKLEHFKSQCPGVGRAGLLPVEQMETYLQRLRQELEFCTFLKTQYPDTWSEILASALYEYALEHEAGYTTLNDLDTTALADFASKFTAAAKEAAEAGPVIPPPAPSKPFNLDNVPF